SNVSNNLSKDDAKRAVAGDSGEKLGIGRVPEGACFGAELLQEPCSPLSEPLPSGLDWVLYGVCIGRTRVLSRRSCVAGLGELSLKLCFRRGILFFRVGL